MYVNPGSALTYIYAGQNWNGSAPVTLPLRPATETVGSHCQRLGRNFLVSLVGDKQACIKLSASPGAMPMRAVVNHSAIGRWLVAAQ